MIERILRWLLFSVLISIVPILATYLILLPEPVQGFENLICRGEIQLISLALLACGIGQIVGTDINKYLRIILIGISTIMLLLIAIWYGSIVSYIIIKEININDNFPVLYTMIAFFASFIISGTCIAIGESS